MTNPGKIPGAKAAAVAFVLTVLLGFGGAAAVGLWQQSATTTMTVTAATAWPGEPTLTCEILNPNGKTATLTGAPASAAVLTAALRAANGSYGTEYSAGTLNATTGIAVLGPTSAGVKEALGTTSGVQVVRITATFAGTPAVVRQIPITVTNNDKVTCAG